MITQDQAQKLIGHTIIVDYEDEHGRQIHVKEVHKNGLLAVLLVMGSYCYRFFSLNGLDVVNIVR